MNRNVVSVFVLSLPLFACDMTKSDASPAASAKASASAQVAASAAASAASGGACPAGCEGDGTFFEKCRCEGDSLPAVPFEATRGEGFKFDKPVWKVTNKTDKDLHWGSVSVYYYDAAGKQLETEIREKTYKRSRMNGSTLSLKPGETKEMGLGFKKDSAPKGAKDMEIIFDGWCYGTYKDKSSHQCITIPAPPKERPKGG